MTSSQTLTSLFLFCLVTFCFAATDPSKLPKNRAIHFSIRKNETTLQYYTTLQFRNSGDFFVDALVDLGAQSVWFDCRSYVSSSYKRASCGSNRCTKAKGSVCIGCNSTPRPGCSNNTCGVYAYNPFRDYLTAQELGEDTMLVSLTDGYFELEDSYVSKFLFSCADADIIQGLPGVYTRGLVGLARTQVSLASQVSSSFNVVPKFALCLPSSSKNGPGDIFVGGGPYLMAHAGDQALSLSITSLAVNPVSTAPVSSEGEPSDEYFLYVKDIQINGKHVSFNSSLLSFDANGVGGTKMSSIAPYTILHASIYKRLVKDFVKAAALMNIKTLQKNILFATYLATHYTTSQN